MGRRKWEKKDKLGKKETLNGNNRKGNFWVEGKGQRKANWVKQGNIGWKEKGKIREIKKNWVYVR